MAGYTMICQSGINVRSDVRGWLSLLTAGVFLMFLIVVLGEWVVVIRMTVLAAIMVMVSIGTYDGSSFNHLRKAPRADAVVLVVTVVVLTGDLSKGVFTGVLLGTILFIAKISKIR